ncbi:MAG: hypothetical protein Q4D98_12180 [Planctomycetia bacterium]|nr:hypothetical protein [Planctomycetia bacterium]
MFVKRWNVVLLLAVVLGITAFTGGCSKKPKMARVTGTVTLDGQPLKYGAVFFSPESGPYQPRGTIQPDGTFEMMTQDWKGAPLGEYKVFINCFESQDPNFKQDPNKEPVRGKNMIPKKYNDAEKSGLTISVKKGMEPVTFELTKK